MSLEPGRKAIRDIPGYGEVTGYSVVHDDRNEVVGFVLRRRPGWIVVDPDTGELLVSCVYGGTRGSAIDELEQRQVTAAETETS